MLRLRMLGATSPLPLHLHDVLLDEAQRDVFTFTFIGKKLE
jgi:predicted component of type VI protein secretion system